MEKRTQIAVLFGGASTEYEISLQSAHAVITSMDQKKYEPILIGIHRDGRWFLYKGEPKLIPADSWFDEETCTPVAISTDRRSPGLLLLEKEGPRLLPLDAAFPVLHGKNGEDGTVQGLFALAGIPVIGCGVLSSALCMDKEMAHRVAAAAGVKVPLSFLITKQTKADAISEAADVLHYPLFVKPVCSGSSFGITRVSDPARLGEAVREAFAHDDRVLLEESIPGFEVGCAVLGNEDPMTGEVDEIELSQGFFDYTEKYTLKTSRIHVPARVSPQKAAELKRTALKLYRALDCSFFARVDLFLTPEGEIYFNEVNTIPGFTVHSRYPSMMKAAGIPFSRLVDSLIEMAVGR